MDDHELSSISMSTNTVPRDEQFSTSRHQIPQRCGLFPSWKQKREDAKELCKVCIQHCFTFLRKLVCALEIHKWREVGSHGFWPDLMFF